MAPNTTGVAKAAMDHASTTVIPERKASGGGESWNMDFLIGINIGIDLPHISNSDALTVDLEEVECDQTKAFEAAAYAQEEA